MLTALLFAALARPATVTFTHPCAHSSVVLAALGEKLGVKMAPGGSVLKDYFAVKLTDQPVEEAKRVIAETLNAVWVQRGEYLVLDRGPVQEANELAEQNASLIAGIRDFLAANPVREVSKADLTEKLRAKQGLDPTTKAGQDAWSALSPYLPQTRIQAAVVRALGEGTLAEIPVGGTLRLYLDADGSSNMPGQLKSTLRDYTEECRRFLELTDELGIDGYRSPIRQAAPTSDIAYLLELKREEYGIQGRLVRTPRGQDLFGSVGINVSGAATPRLRGRAPEFPALEGKPSWSAEALSLLRVISEKATFGRSPVLPTLEDRATVSKLAADFEANDPLRLLDAEVLAQVSQQAHFDYVALLSDTHCFDGQWLAFGETAPMDEVWKRWRYFLDMATDSGTGILKIRPTRPRAERTFGLSRDVVSQYVRSYNKLGYATLDATADFAKDFVDLQQAYRHFEWVHRLTNQATEPQASWVVFKAFGYLSPSQRAEARNEGAILQWSSLNKEVREVLEPMLLSSGCMFSSDESPVPDVWLSNSYVTGTPIGDGLLAKMSAVPKNAVIKIKVYAKDVLRTGPSEQSKIGQGPFDVLNFATHRGADRANGGTDYDSAAVIHVERVNLDVFVPNVGYTYLTAQVDNTSSNTKYVPLDQLPEPIKSQLADAIKKYGGG